MCARHEENHGAGRLSEMKTNKISGAKLYWHYISIHIRSAMQYKASFIMTAIGQFLVSFNMFLGIYFMFDRFGSLEGFTYSEVLLCFSVMLMEYSLGECIARGFDTFDSMVRKGEFDRVMTRPRSEILQVLGSNIELTRVGKMAQAAVMFVYGVTHCGIHWSLPRVITVIFMLMGGTALFCGIFLIYAALCFYTLEGLEFMNILTDGAREYGKYPISIYGKRMMQLCTFMVPYALVQYYPLTFLTGRSDNALYIFLPLFAALFLLPCYLLWRIGVRHYQSAGS